jgi:TonB family protein
MKNNNTRYAMLVVPMLAFTLALGPLHEAAAQTAKKDTNAPYMYVEQMPAYKDGEKEMVKFLAANINYPAEAKANGVEGLAVVQFIVETDGTITDVKPVKKLGSGTDEEAVRVIKLMSGNWTPGKQNGKAVRVSYVMPLRFTLSEAERTASTDKANQMPQYKGGQTALQSAMASYLQLPSEAKKDNLNARVIIKFYVEKDGTVSNIRLEGTKLKKTVGAGKDMDYMDASTFQVQNKVILAKLAEAAMAAVAATSGNWEPATKNGQATGAEIVLPVQFFGSEAAAANKTTEVPAMTKYTKDWYTIEEADVKPAFKDGSFEKFMAKNLRYPETSFEGTIETGFVIKNDGTLIGPLFFTAAGYSKEDNAAIHKEISRLIKLMEGKWEPAKVDGKPVTVTKRITILFITNGGTQAAETKDQKKADVIITRVK